MRIRTIIEYVSEEYFAGNLSLKEAARELCMAGFTNYVDEDYARRLINSYDGRYEN